MKHTQLVELSQKCHSSTATSLFFEVTIFFAAHSVYFPSIFFPFFHILSFILFSPIPTFHFFFFVFFFPFSLFFSCSLVIHHFLNLSLPSFQYFLQHLFTIFASFLSRVYFCQACSKNLFCIFDTKKRINIS